MFMIALFSGASEDKEKPPTHDSSANKNLPHSHSKGTRGGLNVLFAILAVAIHIYVVLLAWAKLTIKIEYHAFKSK